MLSTIKDYLILSGRKPKGCEVLKFDVSTTSEFCYKYHEEMSIGAFSEYKVVPYSDKYLSGRALAHSEIFNHNPLTGFSIVNNLVKLKEFKRGSSYVLLDKHSRVVGTLDLYNIFGCNCLYNVGVIPEEQGKGLAKYFLMSVILAVKSDNKGFNNLYCIVSKDNKSASRLYEKLDFKPLF